MLKRKRQQIPLKNTEDQRRVARVLHDLLPAAILTREPSQAAE